MTNEQKQILREAAITILADNPARAFTSAELERRIRQRQMADGQWNEADLREALALLEGLGFVAKAHAPLGYSLQFQATAQGVLFRERNLP